MHYVESHIAGTHLAEHRVEVGTVVIEKTSRLVHKLGYLEISVSNIPSVLGDWSS